MLHSIALVFDMDLETLQWLRTIASVTLGAILGLLSEPLKLALKDFRERRRIRRLLYLDLIEAQERVQDLRIRMGAGQNCTADGNSLSSERFEYIFDKHRDTFYQLEEAQSFQSFFTLVKSIRQAGTTEQMKDELERFAIMYEFFQQLGALDRKVIDTIKKGSYK